MLCFFKCPRMQAHSPITQCNAHLKSLYRAGDLCRSIPKNTDHARAGRKPR